MRAWLAWGDSYLPQSPGDLGHRLKRGILSAFDEGFRQVAVMGTDTPAATSLRVLEGFEACVPGVLSMGPSLDGGFYFLALSEPWPDLGPLFDHGNWSTQGTAQAVVEGARRQGLEVRYLALERDIDTVEDLEACRLALEGRTIA